MYTTDVCHSRLIFHGISTTPNRVFKRGVIMPQSHQRLSKLIKNARNGQIPGYFGRCNTVIILPFDQSIDLVWEWRGGRRFEFNWQFLCSSRNGYEEGEDGGRGEDGLLGLTTSSYDLAPRTYNPPQSFTSSARQLLLVNVSSWIGTKGTRGRSVGSSQFQPGWCLFIHIVCSSSRLELLTIQHFPLTRTTQCRQFPIHLNTCSAQFLWPQHSASTDLSMYW